MSKKHILVISQLFYPEQFRINDICNEWIKRGYEVSVITGIPNYPQGKFYKGYGLFKKRKENLNGIKIYRLPIVPRCKSPITLMLNYISFVISGYFWKLFTKIKADYVFIYEVSPMTQALVGVWYANKRKIPCYIYVTDLWPENVEFAAGIKSRTIIKLIGRMVDYIYKRCDMIFTSSNSFIKAIHNRGVDLNKIKYWPQYAEGYYKPIKKSYIIEDKIPQDKFNIVFAGNIGVAQGLEILPVSAKILKQKSINVRFNIIGDGRFKENLIEMVKQNGIIDMFNFIDKKPAEQIPQYMAVCQATLITLSKSKIFKMTIPAKLQSYMACAKAIIASADGEIQDIIKESKAGLCSDAGNAEMLAYVIEKITKMTDKELDEMGENALKYYKLNFNKKMLLNQMDEYFKK